MTVELVFTERLSELDESRAQNFERLRERLAVAADGQAVEVSHYEAVDPQRLARASSIVLSGSSTPWAFRDPAELDRLGDAVVAAGRPVLGICAGMQLQVRFCGGEHRPSPTPEHGFLPIQVHDSGDLLRGVPDEAVVFHDHDEEISSLPARLPGARVEPRPARSRRSPTPNVAGGARSSIPRSSGRSTRPGSRSCATSSCSSGGARPESRRGLGALSSTFRVGSVLWINHPEGRE